MKNKIDIGMFCSGLILRWGTSEQKEMDQAGSDGTYYTVHQLH